MTVKVVPTKNPDESCISAGGKWGAACVCECPPGYASSYDAYVTNEFCTIPVEYSPALHGANGSLLNQTSGNSGQGGGSPRALPIGISGMLQLLVVIGFCMCVVGAVRKMCR
jgi:hypothetical protein